MKVRILIFLGLAGALLGAIIGGVIGFIGLQILATELNNPSLMYFVFIVAAIVAVLGASIGGLTASGLGLLIGILWDDVRRNKPGPKPKRPE